MDRNKMTSESREAALERILEETARNPYKSGNASGRTTTPVKEKKPDVKKNLVQPQLDRTQVFSSADAEKMALQDEAKKNRYAYTESATQSFNRNYDENNTDNIKSAQNSRTAYTGEETAAEKIKKIQQEKAAAAKAAIMRKAEIENSRRFYDESEQYEHSADYIPTFPENNSERVNIVMPDEDYEYDFDEDDFSNDTKKSVSKSFIEELLSLVQYSVTILFIILMFFTYVVNLSSVLGESMHPTLSDGDELLVLKAGYSPQKGDVVVIKAETAVTFDENGNLHEEKGLDCKIVKRIIAVGGDTVDFDFQNGEVIVNGEVLEENYISELTTRDEGAFEYPVTIPDGYVFVLGDNRNVSKDSRHKDIGLVPVDEIIGKTVMRIYPFGSFGMID